MSQGFLRVESSGQVRIVRLDREEKRNALCEGMRDELEGCMRESDRDPAVAVVVLTGGERVFSAGFDLEEVRATRFETFRHRAREFAEAVFGFGKPLVVAVGGPALGGGFDLALAGDFIVASNNACFGHPEVNFGSPPALAALWLRVGLAKAKEIAMLGETITAADALRIGLVSRVVAGERLLERALELAGALAAKPSAALRAVKACARKIATFELLAAMAWEAEIAHGVLSDPESLNRLEAHLARLRGGR